MSKGFIINVKIVKGVKIKDLDFDDRQLIPEGEYTYPDAATEDEALDEFHSTIPISCLDDFNITCEEN